MKLNKRGCKVMNVESSNSVCWYRLESSLEENDLRLLVYKELKTSQ